MGIRNNGIQRLECSKFSFSSLLVFVGCSFSLQQVDFFHMEGNMGPETDVSVTKEKSLHPALFRNPGHSLILEAITVASRCRIKPDFPGSWAFHWS